MSTKVSAEEVKLTGSTQELLKFVTAGRARFTVKSLRTGKKVSFQVRAKNEVFFVTLLRLEEGDEGRYIGYINKFGKFAVGRKGNLAETDARVQGFQWLWAALHNGGIEGKAEMYHTGKCCRCGRVLTDPESVARGYGPECAKHMGIN